MKTDFRALCAELADAYLRTLEHINNSTWLGYEPSDDLLLQRTRAALAETDEPAAPDGKEPTAVTGQPNWRGLCAELVDAWLKGDDIVSAMNRARAVLARWGRQPAPPADGEVAECAAELLQRPMADLSPTAYELLTLAAKLES